MCLLLLVDVFNGVFNLIVVKVGLLLFGLGMVVLCLLLVELVDGVVC